MQQLAAGSALVRTAAGARALLLPSCFRGICLTKSLTVSASLAPLCRPACAAAPTAGQRPVPALGRQWNIDHGTCSGAAALLPALAAPAEGAGAAGDGRARARFVGRSCSAWHSAGPDRCAAGGRAAVGELEMFVLGCVTAASSVQLSTIRASQRCVPSCGTSSVAPGCRLPADLPAGTVLGGKYEVVELLGRGGNGTTYRCRRTDGSGGDVAAKVLSLRRWA